MTNADEKRFFELLRGLAIYYKTEIAQPVVDIYWRALQKFDFEAIADAASRHAVDPDQGQFMPKVADLVRLLEGSKVDQSGVAWTKVREALSSVGAYQDVVFDDAYAMATIQDMGGWIKLCHSRVDELPFIEQDFRKRYAGFRVRGIDAYDCPRVLGGIVNADRLTEGQKLQAPMMIGNPQKCAAIMERGKSAGRIEVRSAADVMSGLMIGRSSAAESSNTSAQGYAVPESSAATES